jgi:hypothetical protein
MSQFFVYLFVAARDFVKYVWPAVGPLVGVLIGAYIANRNQRSHWIADSKKEEYRELITAMTKGLSTYLDVCIVKGLKPGDATERLLEAFTQVMEVTRSRLFIKKTVVSVKVVARWKNLTDTFETNLDHSAFAKGMSELFDDVIEAAENDFK